MPCCCGNLVRFKFPTLNYYNNNKRIMEETSTRNVNIYDVEYTVIRKDSKCNCFRGEMSCRMLPRFRMMAHEDYLHLAPFLPFPCAHVTGPANVTGPPVLINEFQCETIEHVFLSFKCRQQITNTPTTKHRKWLPPGGLTASWNKEFPALNKMATAFKLLTFFRCICAVLSSSSS